MLVSKNNNDNGDTTDEKKSHTYRNGFRVNHLVIHLTCRTHYTSEN